MLAAGTMLLSGLFIVRDAVLSSRRGGAPEPFFKTVLPLRLIIVVALVALYITLMPWLGFMAASAGFLYVAFVYLWGRGLVFILTPPNNLGPSTTVWKIMYCRNYRP